MSEALLFLKANHHLWRIKEVSDAHCKVKDTEKKKRTEKKLKEHQEAEAMIATKAAMGNLGISAPVVYNLE